MLQYLKNLKGKPRGVHLTPVARWRPMVQILEGRETPSLNFAIPIEQFSIAQRTLTDSHVRPAAAVTVSDPEQIDAVGNPELIPTSTRLTSSAEDIRAIPIDTAMKRGSTFDPALKQYKVFLDGMSARVVPTGFVIDTLAQK